MVGEWPNDFLEVLTATKLHREDTLVRLNSIEDDSEIVLEIFCLEIRSNNGVNVTRIHHETTSLVVTEIFH